MRAVLPGEKAFSIALIGGKKILRVFKADYKPGTLFFESYTKISYITSQGFYSEVSFCKGGVSI
jgi:hypothetical protein